MKISFFNQIPSDTHQNVIHCHKSWGVSGSALGAGVDISCYGRATSAALPDYTHLKVLWRLKLPLAGKELHLMRPQGSWWSVLWTLGREPKLSNLQKLLRLIGRNYCVSLAGAKWRLLCSHRNYFPLPFLHGSPHVRSGHFLLSIQGRTC